MISCRSNSQDHFKLTYFNISFCFVCTIVIVVVMFLRFIYEMTKQDTYVEELLATVIRATFERVGNKIQPKEVGDIVVGSVLGNNSQRANECRMAGFLAGVPSNVPIHLVNRQCSSGLQALAHVAANISAGNYDVGLACGVESMSVNPMKWEGSLNPRGRS
jgi:acetyl-CoA acyltransferase 1